MPNHRQFPVVVVEPNQEGPSFSLGDQTFRVLPALPAGIFHLVSGNYTADQAAAFVLATLVPEDEERFREATKSKTRVVEPLTLTQIVDWLLEPKEAGGAGLFPFAATPTSLSSNGHGTTGAGSTAPSSSRALASTAST